MKKPHWIRLLPSIKEYIVLEGCRINMIFSLGRKGQGIACDNNYSILKGLVFLIVSYDRK